jgi:ribosomal protein L18E
VKFANSTIRVPFKIYTKEEEKFIDKNWKDIKKQVESPSRRRAAI